jgi:hypothetical protein
MTDTIKAPVGRWWLDDGKDSGVWPCIVHSVHVFGVTVEGDHPNGPYYRERLVVDRNRVYDSGFNRPGGGRVPKDMIPS